MVASCLAESSSVAQIVKAAALDSAEGFLVTVVDVGAFFPVVLSSKVHGLLCEAYNRNWDILKYELPPYASESGVSGGRGNAVSSLGGIFGGRRRRRLGAGMQWDFRID